MELIKIIHDRTNAILERFKQIGAPPKVAISQDHNFKNLEQLFDGKITQGAVEDILYFNSRVSPDESFVLVRPCYEQCREAYIDFINSVYGSDFSTQDLPKGIDIDHLLAKSNSPDYSWIRLEAVAASVNRSHGAGVEKRNSNSPITAARKQSNYHHGSMTWLSAAKLAALKSPLISKSKTASERSEAIIQYFVNMGFERKIVEVGLSVVIHNSEDETLFSF